MNTITRPLVRKGNCQNRASSVWPTHWITILLLLIAYVAQAQPTVTRSFDYSLFNAPTVKAMKTDAGGNIYVAGTYLAKEVYDFDPFGTANPVSDADNIRDVFVAKYDAGGVLQWLRSAVNETASFMEVNDIEIDASGNVHIVGTITGNYARFHDEAATYQVYGNEHAATNYGGAYVVKYSSEGTIQWIWNKRLSGEAGSYSGIGVELSGSTIYVAGSQPGAAYVATLNTSGAETTFTSIGSGDIRPLDFKRDGSGNLYLTGSIYGAVNLGGGAISATSVGDAFIAKYNGSYAHQYGTHLTSHIIQREQGIRLVTNGTNTYVVYSEQNNARKRIERFNASGSSQGSILLQATTALIVNDMVFDNSGNVVIAGYLRGSVDMDPGAGIASLSVINGAYFMASYSSSLSYNWHTDLLDFDSNRKSTALAFSAFNNFVWVYHVDVPEIRKGVIVSLTLQADATVPSISALSPADNASEIANNTNLQITFSENVVAVPGGTIDIFAGGSNALLETITLPSPNVSIAGSVVTINPENDFPYLTFATNYYIKMSGGAFRDAAGNMANPITSSGTWNFLVAADNVAPSITNQLPAHAATEVSLGTNLQLTFSEPIQENAGGVITIRKSADNSVVESFTLPSARVSTSGNTSTIDPTTSLAGSTQYYVTIGNATYKDLAGRNLPGNLTTTFWSFTTTAPPDTAPPMVISLFPTNGAMDASVSASLLMEFNENVSTVATKTIKLIQNKTTIETFILPSAKVKVKNGAVSIDPTNDLTANLEYHITIDAGAFVDAANNPFAGFEDASYWAFTPSSSDVTPPSLVSFTPENGAVFIDPNTNLVVNFSEGISLISSKTALIKNYATDATLQTLTAPTGFTVTANELTINPPAALDAGIKYYVTLENGLVQDGAGNNFTGLTNKESWNFTTLDNTSPTLVSLNPANNATNVSRSVSPIITFSENIQSTSGGSVKLHRYDTDEVVLETILINQNLNSDQYTIHIPAALAYNRKYYFTITDNSFQDAVGNVFAGISSKDTWTFTTESHPNYESVPPTIVSRTPAQSGVDVSRNPGIFFEFSEAVKFKAGKKIEIRRYSTDAIFKSFELSEGSFKTSHGLTEQLLETLEGGTQYYIYIEAGAFEDVWENPFAGFPDKNDWTFTTRPADIIAPTIVSFTPAHQRTDYYLFPYSLMIEFSEPIVENYESTGELLIYRADHSLFRRIGIDELAGLWGGENLQIAIKEPFEPSTTYYILMDYNMILDREGNGFSGIDNENTWRFTTQSEEQVYDIISQYEPARNATNVSTSLTQVKITFNTDMYDNDGYIRLRKSSDNAIVKEWLIYEDAVIDYDNRTITLPLEGITLAEGTTYYVEHLLNDPDQYSPGVIGYSVIVNEQSEDALLPPWANDYWTFTTTITDTLAPAIESLSPANNATDVAINAPLVITFDEPIQSNGGMVLVRRLSDNEIHSTIMINSDMVSENVLTVQLSSDLLHSTAYYVDLGVGMVSDLAGNPFAGQNGNPNWTFTTSEGDFFPTGYTPAHNATDVNKGTNLTLTFAENVGIGAGTISVRKVSDGSLVASLSNYNSIYMTLDGPSITFDFPNDFPENELLYVTITDGYLRKSSNANHTWGGIQDNTSWRFTTAAPADTQAPQIVGVSPPNGSTNVDVNATVTISFNEPLVLPSNGANKSIFFRATDFSWAQSYSLTGPKASISGNNVIITDPEFPYEKTLIFEINNGVLSDVAGNLISEIISTGFWIITTIPAPDNSAPTITSVSPADNQEAVEITDHLIAAFSENITAVANKVVSIRRTVDNSVFDSFTLPHANVAISGTTMTIYPSSNLEFNTGYYVLIEAGAVQDAAGNIFAGIADNTTWNFTTETAPDFTAPTIVSISPADNATNVAVNTQLVVTFSEPILTNEGFISVRTLSDNSVHANIPVNSSMISGETLTATIPSELQFSTEYYVDLGVNMVTDLAGNNFAGQNGNPNWTFTTVAATDTQAPTVVSVNPAHNSTNVAVNSNLVTTFSENVVISVDGAINVRRADNSIFATITLPDPQVAVNGNQMTINLNNDLEYSTTYRVDVGVNAVRDAAGNFFAGLSGATTWTFTTESAPVVDTQAPQIVSISPANGSTNVGSNQTISITFDENLIIPGNGATKAIVLRSTDNLFAESYAFGGDNATVSGNTLTISNPGLPEGKTIYFQLGDGTLADAANNWIDFINSSSFWTIATISTAKEDQTITFNELTTKTFGNAAFTLSASASSGLPVSFEVISGPATVSGTQVTLTGAGLVTIRANQAGDESYNAATAVERSFTVNKAQLTVTADNKTMTYGGNVPSLTVQYAGFVNGQTATVLTTAPSATTVATSNSNAGAYAITVSGGVATNYEFTYGNGTLTINKAEQVITVEPIGDKLASTAPFAVIATVTSGLPLSYSTSGPASMSGNTLTLSGAAGTVTVQVTQMGNINYLPAEASVTFTSIAPRTVSGMAKVDEVAFTNGLARLHPRNEAGGYGTSIDIALGQNGSFSFGNLWPGEYALSVTSSSEQVLTTYYNGKLSLAEATLLYATASDIDGLVVSMTKSPSATQGPGSVSGTLVTGTDGSRQIITSGRKTNGTPLAGVTIHLVTSPDNVLVASTVTAEDGSFSFTNLPLGAYKLVIDYDGLANVESPEIVITAQTTSFEIDSEVTEEGIVIIATPVTPTSTTRDLRLSTYPNPSVGNFTLQWEGHYADVRGVTIYNLNGIAIWKGNLTTDRLAIDISKEPAGIYFLHMVTNSGTSVQKLIIHSTR